MPFLNFGGNKNKHFNLSDMNFFMKNMKNRYSDPDPLRIRIHFFKMWIRGSGSTITESWIRGSGSTFPKCGSEDPDPRQNEMDPKRCSRNDGGYVNKKYRLTFKLSPQPVRMNCFCVICRSCSRKEVTR